MKQLKAKNERLAQDEMAKKERALIQKGQKEIEAQRRVKHLFISYSFSETISNY